MAYGLTQDEHLLSIAKRQDQTLLTGDGLKVAKALDAGKGKPYEFPTKVYLDGANGDEGALVVLREGDDRKGTALIFKATSQGMGHGHFDKLNIQLYDNGNEIFSDYGAARFLNVESKFGGRYLPENNSYAKQSVAHNTLVVGGVSHFKGKVKTAEQHAPVLTHFVNDGQAKMATAEIDTAYDDVVFRRTVGLVNVEGFSRPLLLDLLEVESDSEHTYDLPFHYQGQPIAISFDYEARTQMNPLGEKYGYQHLWLRAKGSPAEPNLSVSLLNGSRFYTHHMATPEDASVLFVQAGANDPDFNLVSDDAYLVRVADAKKTVFASVVETHGLYDPSKEITQESEGKVTGVRVSGKNGKWTLTLTLASGEEKIINIELGKMGKAKPGKIQTLKYSLR